MDCRTRIGESAAYAYKTIEQARSEALVRPCLRALRSEISMFTDRRIERHQLPYFLKVFNSVTDKPIGFLGNLSEDGLMLISQLPMMVGADFNLRLKIPMEGHCQQVIDLNACCLWCHEDETPHHYDAGFSLQQAPPEYGQLVEALKQYFSFQPLPASA
ncbi:hypothetical protein AB7M29_005555 [Pseudomonas sp. F-14 TE3623]